MTVRLRPKPRARRAHRVAVFTAIDAALLPSRIVVTRLHSLGIPVIPVSVMTLDEIAPIADDFAFRDAMVIEAGGAIARWAGAWEVEPCGPAAETLLDVVREIEDRTGARLHVETSTCRSFSEPFTIENGDLTSVRRAAAALGFSIRRGRRFLHLCRQCDEGEAFARVRDELQCEIAIGLGGSPIDAEWLSRCDIPVIVPGAGGADAELVERVPGARIAPSPSPEGWAAAVDAVCETRLWLTSRSR